MKDNKVIEKIINSENKISENSNVNNNDYIFLDKEKDHVGLRKKENFTGIKNNLNL